MHSAVHLSVPQTRFFLVCFLTNGKNYLYQLSFSSIHCPWADSSHKNKSRQKFRVKKMQAQSVVQSLKYFFLANLLWRGVAVNKKRTKVKPRFRSFLQALSSEKNLKHRSSPKAIEIRRNWKRHHKEHVLKPFAKFSFIPTSNGRWPGSWQTF